MIVFLIDLHPRLFGCRCDKFQIEAVWSHQFEDTPISQFVPEDHDPFLRAAVRRLAHCQGHRIRPGAKPQRAGAVGPHAPRTGNRADDGAPTADEWSTRRRAQSNNAAKNEPTLTGMSRPIRSLDCESSCTHIVTSQVCFVSADRFPSSNFYSTRKCLTTLAFKQISIL